MKISKTILMQIVAHAKANPKTKYRVIIRKRTKDKV